MAVVAALGVAGACLTLPAFADSAIEVTFQANNPWTQEVGNVSRRDSSHDYSVAVAAIKTLQINLVTRDPNVFFKVRNDTQDKQLTDSIQTGATTWSTQNTTAATYTIHVYVEPDAMQRGEVADYALQIGQYGQSDMRVPATAVTFEPNKPWVQTVGTLDSQAAVRDYTVAIAAGQTLAVNLITRDPKLHFKVEDQASGQTLVDSANAATTQWSMPVNTAANYKISVYADPSALPPGSRSGYALQIGQYAQRNAPAAAGTAAIPPPATTGSTAAPAEASSAGN
jgi:hypothetical protein